MRARTARVYIQLVLASCTRDAVLLARLLQASGPSRLGLSRKHVVGLLCSCFSFYERYLFLCFVFLCFLLLLSFVFLDLVSFYQRYFHFVSFFCVFCSLSFVVFWIWFRFLIVIFTSSRFITCFCCFLPCLILIISSLTQSFFSTISSPFCLSLSSLSLVLLSPFPLPPLFLSSFHPRYHLCFLNPSFYHHFFP